MSKITVPLFSLCGFTFSLLGFGFVSGLAIASPAHPIWPLAIMVVSLSLSSAGLAVASKRTAG